MPIHKSINYLLDRIYASATIEARLFGDAVIASAVLDRLLYHCRVININGRSYG